jgi:hypothetical protein
MPDLGHRACPVEARDVLRTVKHILELHKAMARGHSHVREKPKLKAFATVMTRKI